MKFMFLSETSYEGDKIISQSMSLFLRNGVVVEKVTMYPLFQKYNLNLYRINQTPRFYDISRKTAYRQ